MITMSVGVIWCQSPWPAGPKVICRLDSSVLAKRRGMALCQWLDLAQSNIPIPA